MSLRDRDANDVPDFAEIIVKAAEKSRKVYAAEGYRKPMGDGTTPDHGPNSNVDIYLLNLGDAARETAPGGMLQARTSADPVELLRQIRMAFAYVDPWSPYVI